MKPRLSRVVRDRAGGRCEYCHLPEEGLAVPFEVDHVIAPSHGGRTIAANLALSCFYCDKFKGPNIAGFDPKSGKLTRLFHPRRHRWPWHFAREGSVMVGRTPIGRTTVLVLQQNFEPMVLLRESLMAKGGYF